jgi:predicted O-methyltransferase YrrM
MGVSAYTLQAALKIVLFPGWIVFRLTNRRKVPRGAVIDKWNGLTLTTNERDKESAIIEILSRSPGGSFLEVGIGASPHMERLRIVLEREIEYTACDFQKVCDLHRTILERMEFKGKVRFIGNRIGTYVWTLFKMQEQGEEFDVVYLDGHHTFYIDLPAIMIAHHLLKPGGYLLVDDVDWSMQTLRVNMFQRYREWLYYRNIYNFREYSPEQQLCKHLKMIVEQEAIKELGYEIDWALSSSNWYALRKGALNNQ